jgi:hypothetical protein
MKTCTKCKIEKSLEDFPKQKTGKFGRHPHCKKCKASYDKSRYSPQKRKTEYLTNHEEEKKKRREYYTANKEDYYYRKALRRAAKLKATPAWYEAELVSIVYKKAKELCCHVDHIVPLQNPLVCGLHCWANLQLLPEDLNKSKGNHYWPDMP